jgi:hypothetical protein
MAPVLIKETTSIPMLGLRSTRISVSMASLIAGVGAKVARTDFTWKPDGAGQGRFMTGSSSTLRRCARGRRRPAARHPLLLQPIYTGVEKFGPVDVKVCRHTWPTAKPPWRTFGTRCHYELWNEPNLVVSGRRQACGIRRPGQGHRWVMKQRRPAVSSLPAVLRPTLPDRQDATAPATTVELDYVAKFVAGIDKTKIDMSAIMPIRAPTPGIPTRSCALKGLWPNACPISRGCRRPAGHRHRKRL